MYYGAIKNYDVADGPGVRVCLYVSGCRNCCPGCHNKETWNFSYGEVFTNDTLQQILGMLKPDFVSGFSLCGGEPFEPENQAECVHILKKIKSVYPNKTIWVWSGYEWDDIAFGIRHYSYTNELLSYIDVIVTGPYIEPKRDISDRNRWRGSTNQRVIDVQKSITDGEIVYLKDIPNNL